MKIPPNISAAWSMATLLKTMAPKYPALANVIAEYADRVDPGYVKATTNAVVVEFLWSRAQAFLGADREPGWHRRILLGYPSDRPQAAVMAWEQRKDATEMWKMGASRGSAELIRLSEATRAISTFTLGIADGSVETCGTALKHIVQCFPQLDYEVAALFPKWNEYADRVATQGRRQEMVFTNPTAQIEDE